MQNKSKIIKFINVFIMLCCLSILQGCAGFLVYTSETDTQSIYNPSISKNYGKVHENLNTSPINEYTLKTYWGLPYKINDLGGGKSEWIYRRYRDYPSVNDKWRGVFILIVIIPVPLLLPTGNEEIKLTLENGFVKSAYIEEKQETACGGLLFCFGPDGPSFFDAGSRNKIDNIFFEESIENLISKSIEPSPK